MLRSIPFHIILMLIVCPAINATSIEVCSSCTHTTLSAAITIASPHDSILLGNETYIENDIRIDIPLTITGAEGAVIDGDMQGNILIITADSVTIKGLTIRNVPTSYTKDYAAVKVIKSKYFAIENNVFEDIFFGIYLEKSSHGVIRDNSITSHAIDEISSGNGIHLFYCNNLLVEGNYVSHVRDGIYLEFVDDSRIVDNVSEHNIRYGLHFMFSNRDEYSRNTFMSNGAGVAVMFSSFISMTENHFVKNWGTSSYGLLLKEINDAEIRHNKFEKNTIAINIEGSNRINYISNNFVSNGWAMKFRGGCYKNQVNNNNFLHNTFDISYHGKINDNSFIRNYWSAYTGYDLDRNGIGDIPFRPVKLFSYIVNENPSTIVLLRSLFVDLINFSEKVSPVFTPDNLRDEEPLMRTI